MNRFNRVIARWENGSIREVEEPRNREAMNFRIVSHHGKRDWSPYLYLYEARKRFRNLPARADGYFLLVED